MTDALILTAEEADKVRGRSPKDAGCAIDPRPMKDGRFILGAEVLDDPAHEDVRDFLASLPRAEIEKLPLYEPEDIRAEEPAEVARLSVRAFDTEREAKAGDRVGR